MSDHLWQEGDMTEIKEWVNLSEEQWQFLAVLAMLKVSVSIKTLGLLVPLQPGPLFDLLNRGKEMNWIIQDGKESFRISHDISPNVKAKLPEKIKDLFKGDYKLLVNPTGKFVIGGPHGDTGLTGRKIIVDTYGGRGAHGGGAFSGKDSSKVDRSAAYATRHIAKNLVAAGVADEVLVQVAYAIGVAQPVGLYVNTYGTSKVNLSDSEIAEKVNELFDMRPAAIVKRFGLKNPIFRETAAYGHMGREPFSKKVTFSTNGNSYTKDVDFFAWEKLDYVDKVKEVFNL